MGRGLGGGWGLGMVAVKLSLSRMCNLPPSLHHPTTCSYHSAVNITRLPLLCLIQLIFSPFNCPLQLFARFDQYVWILNPLHGPVKPILDFRLSLFQLPFDLHGRVFLICTLGWWQNVANFWDDGTIRDPMMDHLPHSTRVFGNIQHFIIWRFVGKIAVFFWSEVNKTTCVSIISCHDKGFQSPITPQSTFLISL